MSAATSLPALDAGNQIFHEAYAASRDDVRQESAILVVLPTELALHHRGKRQTFPYSRPSFGRAKSAAHIAVALFTLAQDGRANTPDRSQWAHLAGHIRSILDGPRAMESQPIDQEIRALLENCQRFVRIAHDRASEAAQGEFAEFASDAGRRILSITELATRDQIAGLHEAVDQALRTLSNAEQRELQVVVVGDHQARTRSLGMQYFKRRFHERSGADERVTYGENISNEEEALALAATRQLDKLIARAFFGDEKRLQRDVLGDAAMRCLDEMQF